MTIPRRRFIASALGTAAILPFARAWAADGPPLQARTLDGGEVQVARADVADLAAGMRGAVLLADSAQYDSGRHIWNGAFDWRPALIARCTGQADVRRAVEFARAHRLLTAVRGGGHSTSGKSSCNGGIMIDLAPMQGVRVDPQARRAWVEPGTLLGQLDHETAAFGLVTTAGTVSHTGAAGLTLGGGFGRVGRRFGLACDNLVGADLITADGQRVRASETENPELLWGLRGGGGNFGVVTGFEYRLHPMRPVIWGGVIAWPASAAREVLRTVGEIAENAPDELNIEPILVTPPGAPPMVIVEVCWSGDDHAAGAARVAKLRTLPKPVFDKLGPLPYVVLQQANDAANPHGIRHYSKAGFVPKLDEALIDSVVTTFLGHPPGSLGYVFQQCGGQINRVAPDATAFPNRGATYWIMVMANWMDPAEDESRKATARAAWKTLEPLTRGFYVNSATERDEGAIRGNYGANYARLVALKDRYDPGNQFRLNVNVKPGKA
jgi:FAD/FMN-containing dehydrogenase